MKKLMFLILIGLVTQTSCTEYSANVKIAGDACTFFDGDEISVGCMAYAKPLVEDGFSACLATKNIMNYKPSGFMANPRWESMSDEEQAGYMCGALRQAIEP